MIFLISTRKLKQIRFTKIIFLNDREVTLAVSSKLKYTEGVY